MWAILIWIFAICLLINHIKKGGSLILLTKIVTLANSIREKSPRFAKEKGKQIRIEYKYGDRIHCIIFDKKGMIPWTHAGALINGEWVDKTRKLKYFAGPLKNFHGLPVMPKHISPKYEKLSFIMDDGCKIHVLSNEIISEKLISEHIRLIKEKATEKQVK